MSARAHSIIHMRHNLLLRGIIGLTVLSIGFLIVALVNDRVAKQEQQVTFLSPDFINHIEQIDKIRMTHGLGISGVRHLWLHKQDGLWHVPARAHYPANQELVNETLFEMAHVKLVQPRTQNPQWHRKLGLVAPEELGKAIRFSFFENETEIFAFFIGNEEASELDQVQATLDFAPDAKNFYVRRASEAQSWLARGRVPRSRNMAAWIDPSLPLFAVEDIAFLTSGNSGKDFYVDDTIARWVGDLQNMRPSDVALRAQINFRKASFFTITLKNGISIKLTSIGAGMHIWTHYQFSLADKADAAARAQFETWQSRFEPWAYKFESQAAAILLPAFAGWQDLSETAIDTED